MTTICIRTPLLLLAFVALLVIQCAAGDNASSASADQEENPLVPDDPGPVSNGETAPDNRRKRSPMGFSISAYMKNKSERERKEKEAQQKKKPSGGDNPSTKSPSPGKAPERKKRATANGKLPMKVIPQPSRGHRT